MAYTVCFVDDEPYVLQGLAVALNWEDMGFRVAGCFDDSVAALKSIVAEKPDLVIIDIRMPEMGGLECIRRAAQRGADSLFLVLSGHADFEYARESLVLNVVDYLLKPLDKGMLAAGVLRAREMLDEKHRLRGLLEKADNGDAPQEIPPSRHSGTFAEVLGYVDTHFQQDLPLVEVAAQFHINPNYLSSLFKKSCGCGFLEYITTLRMRRASQLLLQTDMPIKEIAIESKYSDYSSFVKAFKKHMGVPPARYRKNGGKGLNSPTERML